MAKRGMETRGDRDSAEPFAAHRGLGRFESRPQRLSLSVKPHQLTRAECVKSIRMTGLVTELDVEGVAGQHLDDRANLACGKAKLWHIGEERYGVEELNR